SWLAHRLDTRVLGAVFALVLLRVAYKNLKEGRLGHADTVAQAELPCIRSSAHGRFIWTSQCALRLSGMGIVAGLLSGLLGVGGGFVIVPALQRYTDLAMQSVVATSLAVIALISLSGVASSVLGGRFDYALGLPFAAGAVVGMLLGGRLAARYHPRHLKTAFGLVCLVVAVGLLAKSLF
ncbi:MAG TPA: sulfite exporter TauE/SafE family protein, partial [Rhodocyclaceae bacterium]|nr:sulfite exporter TauE/SafE family protein [Rhodocyclaceae bacterium]